MSDSTSVQLQGEALEPLIGGMNFPLQFFSASDIAPDWDAGDRDGFLRSFWKRFGNDILQAVLAVSVAKVLTQNFVITGPEKMAEMYLNIVRDNSDFYRGYSSLIMRGVQDYYTQDNGWFMERERSAPDDYEGPCLGLNHIDSARMYPTGNDDFPYAYMDVYGKYHLMHRSQFIRIVDLRSPVSKLYHHQKGFCALSRALSTAMILTLLVAMKREKLSDLPPSALAIFNNINKKQYESALRTYGDKEQVKGNEVWRSLLPLFGINPAHPADIKFISLREVWEGFDDEQATNVAVYAFAAAWRMDPREVWPVSSGPLGTGKEAEVQHEKAKAKSFGLLFTEVERAFNSDLTLPPMLNFKFQLEDTEEEKFRADIHNVQIANIKSMQEAGASLTPAEVRKLLCLEWHILPRYMMNVPKEAQQQIAQSGQPGQQVQEDQNAQSGADQTARDDAGRIPPDTGSADLASVTDISEQHKEFGTFFGPMVSLNVDGTKEYHYGDADQTYRYAAHYNRAHKNLVDYVNNGSDDHLRYSMDDMRLLGLISASQYVALKGSKQLLLAGSKEYYIEHPEDINVMSFADSLRVYADNELDDMQAFGAYKELSLVASEQEGLLERVKKMPRERRIAIQSQASKLRVLMSPESRLAALEAIPESDFDDESDEGEKGGAGSGFHGHTGRIGKLGGSVGATMRRVPWKKVAIAAGAAAIAAGVVVAKHLQNAEDVKMHEVQSDADVDYMGVYDSVKDRFSSGVMPHEKQSILDVMAVGGVPVSDLDALDKIRTENAGPPGMEGVFAKIPGLESFISPVGPLGGIYWNKDYVNAGGGHIESNEIAIHPAQTFLHASMRKGGLTGTGTSAPVLHELGHHVNRKWLLSGDSDREASKLLAKLESEWQKEPGFADLATLKTTTDLSSLPHASRLGLRPFSIYRMYLDSPNLRKVVNSELRADVYMALHTPGRHRNKLRTILKDIAPDMLKENDTSTTTW